MKLVVGVADMQVTGNPTDSIVTYSLGSCIGLCIHDPVAKVGGILHYMLPESKISPEKAAANPYMFADTGIPALFRKAYDLGAFKGRITVRAVGGARILDAAGLFDIGKRNILALKKILWQNALILGHSEVGGSVNRTVTMEIATGEIDLKTSGQGVTRL
ncbi:MAG: chemotaxis protein CheD [Candidatus Deferrimicrobiaceae bacterium]